MGYPASAALLFKALTQEEDKWLLTQARIATYKFSLFAIILADPVKNPEFYNHLQKEFSFYDRLTGKNFLFFSIIKAADYEVFDGAHKQFKIFNDSEAYKQNHAAEETIYSELAIHAICSILGVNYDETPCLIISNNIEFGQFCKISTGINELEKQMISLRNVADYLSHQTGITSLSGLLNKFNQNVNFFETVESVDIDKDSLKIISEILQVVSKEGMFSEKTFDKLKNNIKLNNLAINKPQINERIQEALSLLSGLDKGLLWDIPPLNMLSQVSEPDIEYIRKSTVPTKNDSSKLYKEWLNVQASTKNHLECAAYMEKNMKHLFTDDYSTLTFPLCKSFETEITYSAVQLLRKYLGVNMPRYFSKYCPSLNNLPITPLPSLVNNPREIYFNNKRSDGKWIP